jgi:putative hydrolase of the HAD superfamily
VSRAASGSTLDAVSFDAAGTLFHARRPIGELYAGIAARHGVTVGADVIDARFRAAFTKAPPLAFPDTRRGQIRERERAWWRTLVSRVFAGMPFTSFDAYFDDLFAFFASTEPWRIDPDAIAVLEELRGRGLRILVVSNFDSRVRGIIQGLGLAALIDDVVLSSEAGAAKPDPAIFQVALDRAALTADRVVHVGDTVREDFRGARAAGIDVVLVGGPELGAAAPDATVIARLAELPRQLEKRARRRDKR